MRMLIRKLSDDDPDQIEGKAPDLEPGYLRKYPAWRSGCVRV